MLASRNRAWRPKSAACFRFKNGESIPCLAKRYQFFLLVGRKSVSLIVRHKVVHACLLILTKAEIEDVSGNNGAELPLSVSEEARKNGNFFITARCVCQAYDRLHVNSSLNSPYHKTPSARKVVEKNEELEIGVPPILVKPLLHCARKRSIPPRTASIWRSTTKGWTRARVDRSVRE